MSLSIKNLSFSYGVGRILDDIALEGGRLHAI